jgi:hypothetical protein
VVYYGDDDNRAAMYAAKADYFFRQKGYHMQLIHAVYGHYHYRYSYRYHVYVLALLYLGNHGYCGCDVPIVIKSHVMVA